ncbi:Fc.00g010470.m01.CDS01 [Cosmosporella sp. VM-42]
MPKNMHDIASDEAHKQVHLLIHELINIEDTTGEWVVKLEDGTSIDPKGWNDWEWTHGVGLFGIWKYYEMTGKGEWLKIIENWFQARFREGHKGKNINTMSVFLTLAYVYEKTRNPIYLPWLESWAEWAYYDLPRTKYGGMQHITYIEANKDELWDDTLMMTVLPLAKIGLILDRPHYIAEVKRQFLIHLQYLFDTKTGLFFHGWIFKDGGGGHNFADARWGRGNSWLTITIPEFIEMLDLPQDDPIRYFFDSALNSQCEALAKLQAPNGLWRTLLDDEDSYVEASATAGFAYGILKAIRLRYIGQEYSDVAIRAIKAVLENISPEGELLNTSYGTTMGHSLKHYKDIPLTSMPYGQAMAIMALVEYLRVYM